MNAEERYADARLKVAKARARAMETGQEIKARLAPQNIAQKTWERARATGEELADRGANTLRSHPVAAAGAGLAAVALMLRRPIWRVTKGFLSRRRRAEDDE